ncbi:hypothetical protein ACQ5A1_007051, partial [Pseudomonas aeruginosa]
KEFQMAVLAEHDNIAVGDSLRQGGQLADSLSQKSAQLFEALLLVLGEAELRLHAFHEIKAALVEETDL